MFTKLRFHHDKSMDAFAIKAVALFECEKCGFCCKFMPCELSEEEIPSYKKLIKPEDWEDATKLKAPCTFFDDVTNRCTIYDQRPIICKRFPLYPVINDFTGIQYMHISSINHCKLTYDIVSQIREFTRKKMNEPIEPLDKKALLNKDKDFAYNYIVGMLRFETFIEWKKMKLEKI